MGDIYTVVEFILLLPGRHAAQVRRQAAELFVRYFGGDLNIVAEVCRIRGFQEELAVHQPDDPRRIFGEAVEAASEVPAAEQFSRACTEALARALLGMLDKLTAHIDERLANLDERHRVNLNVRAPKRPAPYNMPIARTISGAGRPLPLAKFLDEKERLDPSWRATRRSFAPTFGMVMQVLKKKQLKDSGDQPIYVEQNHRPQLLYTENDRALMENAWALSAAHRESLSGSSQARVALADRQSVLDLLCK